MTNESTSSPEHVLRPKKAAGGKRIPPGYIHPSAAYSVRKNQIKTYSFADHEPRCGDVVYAQHIGAEHGRHYRKREAAVKTLIHGFVQYRSNHSFARKPDQHGNSEPA